ncbi:hypothetical protein NC652_037531 [Populus alba x Populus x berolinensis]|nr:hypothetical protein NC652_037505 [Populus alba x Populus x berolinensis]KAJ6865999.1 hypothetical protein NC652_037508 [Populus alba x Populus x berolinensis]KAJ6866019.1 hypothetical protein NC652_037520 [Populus alba x Populus x berolinensis]KAJ6866030.1 hypothetical protein NC652_037531 [Populus alba x Populus x berolinensis]
MAKLFDSRGPKTTKVTNPLNVLLLCITAHRKKIKLKYLNLLVNMLIIHGINFIHIKIFNLLIKIYLTLIFINYFINKYNI